MWNTIVNDLRKLKDMHTRAAEVAKEQVELELKMGKCKLSSFESKFLCSMCLCVNWLPPKARYYFLTIIHATARHASKFILAK